MNNWNSITFIITSCSLLACSIPLALGWNIPLLDNRDNILPIVRALQSNEYYTSLVAILCISIPVVIDIVVRTLLHPNIESAKQVLFSGAFITTILTIVDLITLLYVTPEVDVNALLFLIKVKVILTASTAIILISEFGGSKWSSFYLLLCFSLICLGRITSFYRIYFNKGNSYMNTISIICDIFGMSLFLILSLNWFLHIYNETKLKPLTKSQYLCNLYVLAITSCAIGWILSVYSYNSNSNWCYTDATHLVIYSMSYGVYYILILMFEGRALQRDVISTKVTQ